MECTAGIVAGFVRMRTVYIEDAALKGRLYIKMLLRIAVGYGDSEDGLGFFGGIDFEGLGNSSGVVIAPEPDHFGGKFGGAVGGVVRAFSKAEMKIVILGVEGVGHAEIIERPIAVAKVEIVGTVLEPYANVAMRFAESFFGIVLAAVGIGWIFFPLNGGEAADPGDHAGELIGHLPGGVEGSDAAGGKSGDGMAVAVFAEIIFCRDFGEDFVAEETRITVADSVVQRAAHGILESAIPFFAVGFNEIVSGRAAGIGDISRIDEDADHDGNFLLGDEIVDDVERGIVAVAVGVPAAVVENHYGGGSVRFILRGNVNPIFTFHAVVNFAGVGDFFGERAGWNAGMLIGEERESGNVEFASEFCAVDGVVERVELAQLIDGRSGVPEIGVRQWIHRRAGQIVDHEERKGRRTGSEEKIGAVADPGCSFLQVFGVEGGSDGVAEGWAGRFGEF